MILTIFLVKFLLTNVKTLLLIAFISFIFKKNEFDIKTGYETHNNKLFAIVKFFHKKEY